MNTRGIQKILQFILLDFKTKQLLITILTENGVT